MDGLRRLVAAGPEARALAIAVVRLAFLPAVFVVHEVRDPPVAGPDPFLLWFCALTLYALAALALSLHGVRVSIPVLAAVDLAFLAALTYHSGGAASHLRYAFLAVPLGAAFLMRPRLTAFWTVAAAAAYVAAASLHPDTHTAEGGARVLTQVIYVAWLGAASVLFSSTLARRSQKIGELAEARGRLAAELVGAEEQERRRVATLLHDGPVQNLMLARGWLRRAPGGDSIEIRAAEEAVTEAIEQLRGTMQDLHPYVLDFAGLGPALELASEHAMPEGMRCDVDVQRDATGFRDQILYSVARELLVNAAKHADGERVTVDIARTGDTVELRVRDDGRGFAEGRRMESLREGHIGLASCAQRIEALGGRFEVASTPGAGTDIRAVLPIGATGAPAEPGRRRALARDSFAPGGPRGLQTRGAD